MINSYIVCLVIIAFSRMKIHWENYRSCNRLLWNYLTDLFNYSNWILKTICALSSLTILSEIRIMPITNKYLVIKKWSFHLVYVGLSSWFSWTLCIASLSILIEFIIFSTSCIFLSYSAASAPNVTT